jgi:hypothetical protein
MLAEAADPTFDLDVLPTAPVRLVRFLIGFAAVMAATAAVGAVFYLALLGLSSVVSLGEAAGSAATGFIAVG